MKQILLLLQPFKPVIRDRGELRARAGELSISSGGIRSLDRQNRGIVDTVLWYSHLISGHRGGLQKGDEARGCDRSERSPGLSRTDAPFQATTMSC